MDMNDVSANWRACGPLGLEELTTLFLVLTGEERDELLQCLLIAASRGEAAMTQTLGQAVLCHATLELINDVDEGIARIQRPS